MADGGTGAEPDAGERLGGPIAAEAAMADTGGVANAAAAEAEAAMPDVDEYRLSHEFYDVYKTYYNRLVKPDGAKLEQAELESLTGKLKAIGFHVVKFRLFSPNEELDDISTADLKYLLVPYLLAEVSAATQDMAERMSALRQALVYWRAFAFDCQRLGVAHADDWRAIDGDQKESSDPASKRDQKIARFRRTKELDQKVEYLFSKKREVFGDEFHWGAGGSFDEDMERQLVLALLGRAVATTADNIASAEKELPLLEMMMARGGPGAQPPDPQPTEKPWSVRLQDKAEVHRLYKEMVFQCPYAQPTISIEQAGEAEMSEMREREAANAERARREQAWEDERWWRGDRYGSKEDEEDEKATYKARDWDDWKDEHPYGSGNKMGNIG